MFKNYNTCFCYFNKSINVVEPFVKITNYTPFEIYFILQYNSQRGYKTRQSGVFGRGVSKQLSFTRNAMNIAFNVINNSLPSKDLICNRELPNPGYYYFNVIETPSGLKCVQD